MKHFDYTHLREPLRSVSRGVCDLAHEMDESLPDGPEKSAGLRRLLEAKDCFVRAKLDEPKKTAAELKEPLKLWLTEFPNDDPEQRRRAEHLVDFFKSIGAAKLSDIEEREQIDQLHRWFEQRKAEGRLIPPKPFVP